jgi:benzil reductase ((S)-benzoin forming)
MRPPPFERLFIITGTNRGIGKALAASALRQVNSFVVSLSRTAAFHKPNHQNIHVDLNNADTIGQAFKAIDLQGRPTDALTHTVLINNAGVLEPVAPIGECDDLLLVRNIQVNLTAPLILSRYFFHFSKAFPGRKGIVNITSGASRTPYYGWSAYGAAKAGLDMATRAMALEFSRIDPSFYACAVAPGTVDTGMQATIRSCTRQRFEQVDKFLKLKESGGLDAPENVASTLIALLLEERLKNGERYDLREMKA